MTLEASIEKYLVRCVKEYRGLVLKLVPFNLKGIPDRLIVLPGPRIIFVEVKRPKGGVVARHQTWWMERLTDLGCEHAFVYATDDVDKLIGKRDERPLQTDDCNRGRNALGR
jgi:hypothetical protein